MTNFGFQPRCKKVSLDKLIITPQGVLEPLCQTCIHKDCGNPIEPKQISIFGVTKVLRLYISVGAPMAVVDCEGYSKEESVEKDGE